MAIPIQGLSDWCPQSGFSHVSASSSSGSWLVCSLALLLVAKWPQQFMHPIQIQLQPAEEGLFLLWFLISKEGLFQKPFSRLSRNYFWSNCIICLRLYQSLVREGRCCEWLRAIMMCLLGLRLGFSSSEEVYSLGNSGHKQKKCWGWWCGDCLVGRQLTKATTTDITTFA